MTENKRYTTDNGSNEDVCLVDNVTGKEFESDFDEIVDLLNEQEEVITNLRLSIEVTGKAYRKSVKDYEEFIEELEKENEQLKKELKNRKKMNNILEGFLLDKGYDFNDIIKFLQDKTEKGE